MTVLKKNFWLYFKKHLFLLSMPLLVCVYFYPVFLGKVPLPGDFVLGVYSPWIDHKWPGFPDGVPVKNPILADVVSFTYPMQRLAIGIMKSGHWPLWNPYILGGTPLLANFQSAPFAVTNIVYLFFDFVTGWTVRILFQHFLAIIFTYMLLREWKVGKLGALVGGVVFAFSGFNIIWSLWNAHALTAAFISLVLFFETRYLRGQRARDGVLLSFSLTLQIFSGYPQVVIYSLGVYGLYWIFSLERNAAFFVKSLKLLFFFVLGLLGAFVQLLPAKELLDFSQRAVEPHPYEWAFLPLSKIITFIAPDYFGNHATGNWWGPQDYTSNTGFVGIVAATLAMFGLYINKKRTFLLTLFVFSLVLSFATPLSIFLWKSGFLGFQAASAHRALVLTNFSVAALSGFGVDYVIQNKNRFHFLPFLIVFFILTPFTLLLLGPFRPHLGVAARNLIFPFASFFLSLFFIYAMFTINKGRSFFIFLLLLLGFTELFRFGSKYMPYVDKALVFPTTPVLSYLQNQEMLRTTGDKIIPINLRMNYGISSLEGYDAVYPMRVANFLTVLNGGSYKDSSLGRYAFVNDDVSRLLNIANVSYIISKRDEDGNIPTRFLTERFQLLDIGEPKVLLFKNKEVFPHSFTTYKYVNASENKALELLADPKFDLSKNVILSEGITLENGEGVLVTADTYYPGWRASVDGVSTQILQADYIFRGVKVSRGSHNVVFSYEPESFYAGLNISVVTFGFLCLMFFIPLFKKLLGNYN